jgi:hypothetical protein
MERNVRHGRIRIVDYFWRTGSSDFVFMTHNVLYDSHPDTEDVCFTDCDTIDFQPVRCPSPPLARKGKLTENNPGYSASVDNPQSPNLMPDTSN